MCEALRLLEPTHATQMSDFRTGKRLNMRAIIPFVASQFRKDKIWLRRKKKSNDIRLFLQSMILDPWPRVKKWLVRSSQRCVPRCPYLKSVISELPRSDRISNSCIIMTNRSRMSGCADLGWTFVYTGSLGFCGSSEVRDEHAFLCREQFHDIFRNTHIAFLISDGKI